MMIQTSIWSSKYKLKIKYQITSPENISNSVIIGQKLTRKRKSLKDSYVLINSHNGSIIQSDEFPEDQDLNKTVILDVYNSNNKPELIVNTKETEDYLYLAKDNTSPELFRQKNPFIKQVSNLTTSPSVLSNGNYRKRGKNLMRIRRTIIDENVLIESKYFLKQGKECSILESKNKEPEVNLKNIKHNIVANMEDMSVHDINQKQLEKTCVTDIAQNISLVENIDDAVLSNQNNCLSNTYRNVSENSNSNNKNNDVSSMTYPTMDQSYSSDFLESSFNIEANDITTYENANSLQNDLSKWKNTEKDRISYKTDTFKKQSSTNLVNKFTHTQTHTHKHIYVFLNRKY